nr:MAG TPA: hypothetical protein [Caudoviricetes sp.]
MGGIFFENLFLFSIPILFSFSFLFLFQYLFSTTNRINTATTMPINAPINMCMSYLLYKQQC